MQPTPQPETIVIEADSAEDALEQVTETIGTDAEILNAELVSSGGVAGFFARERVRITARPRMNGVDLKPDRMQQPDPATLNMGSGLDAAIDKMLEETDAIDMTFQQALAEQLSIGGDPIIGQSIDPLPSGESWGDQVGSPQNTEIPEQHGRHAEGTGVRSLIKEDGQSTRAFHATALRNEVTFNSPRTDTPAPNPEHTIKAAGTGRVRWSEETLLNTGLPRPVVEKAMEMNPAGEMAWLNALAHAVEPLCGPIPGYPMVLAGPRAHRFAKALSLEVFKPEELPPYGGSFIANVTDHTDDQAWLAYVRGDRPLHLAVDEPWQGVAGDEPLVVSWTSEHGVATAVKLAWDLRATLGYGTTSQPGARVIRANPLDVAIAVRTLLERE